MNIFKNIVLWFYIKYLSIMTYIGIALKNTQDEILSSNPILNEKDELNYMKLHRNPVLNEMNQGVKNEQYYQEYYTILKKADKFMKTATSTRIAQVADRYAMNYGQKDQYGKRYEHYGFFDEQHKHHGKTLGEVLISEFEERRLKDDNLEILYIINNRPIEEGLSAVDKELTITNDGEIVSLSEKEKAKKRVFPMKVNRDIETNNKIEQLAEFVHIKKIGMEYRMYEFFIPKKFKLYEQSEDGKIFQDLINFKNFWFRDEYGKLVGFAIEKYEKLIKDMEHYDVIKLSGIEIENMNKE